MGLQVLCLAALALAAVGRSPGRQYNPSLLAASGVSSLHPVMMARKPWVEGTRAV